MDANELLERYAEGERDFPNVELFDYHKEFVGDKESSIHFNKSVIHQCPVNLEEANIAYINLFCANLKGANLKGANLKGANLSRSDLSNADLSNIEQIEEEFDTCAPMKGYQECENDFINLSYAKLRNADLTGADLTGTDLTGADLTGTDLTGADLTGTNLGNADLSDANLSALDLSYMNLSNTKLVNANLSDADLTGADLTGADLTGADLTGANLTFTILTGTDLTGTDLSRAEIFDTIFGHQSPSEELQEKNQELEELRQKNQELVESINSFKIQASRVSIEDWLKPLLALQSDFIKRLKSNQLLFSPLSSSNEGLHKESIIVSGEERRKIRNFGWDMVKKFNRSDPKNSFRNSLKGKLGEEGIRSCLGDLVAPVDYNIFPGGDGGVDLRVRDFPDIGIQVKTTHNTIEKAYWKISEKEKELNKVLACVLILEEIEDDQPEFNLVLAGFLPTFKIMRNEVKMNDLLYIGGLQGYLNLIMSWDTYF
jgi:uncharacterized protein YjbI with pentapeptide repeats